MAFNQILFLEEKNRYFSRVSANGIYTLGFLGPMIELEPGNEKTTAAKFYVGPENTDNAGARKTRHCRSG